MDNKTLGKRIAMLRKEKKLKAKDVAKLIPITEPVYNRYENGNTTISVPMLFQIAKAIDIPVSKILNLDSSHQAIDSPHSFLGNGNQNCNNTSKEIIDMLIQSFEMNKQIFLKLKK